MKIILTEVDQIYDYEFEVGVKVFRIFLKLDNGLYGFNECQEGRNIEEKMLAGGVCIRDTEVVKFENGNCLRIKSQNKLDENDVVIHGAKGSFSDEVFGLDAYFKKEKINELKRRMGKNVAKTSPPSWFKCKNKKKRLLHFLDFCDFLSVWPKYWGEYGSHCYMVCKDLDTVLQSLSHLFGDFTLEVMDTPKK